MYDRVTTKTVSFELHKARIHGRATIQKHFCIGVRSTQLDAIENINMVFTTSGKKYVWRKPQYVYCQLLERCDIQNGLGCHIVEII